jgi:hypothetical protein
MLRQRLLVGAKRGVSVEKSPESSYTQAHGDYGGQHGPVMLHD